MNKVLYTNGSGEFLEGEWEMPSMNPTDIMVKSRMTGVCRSDIDMMQGKFGPLPLGMQGHEGLGQVLKVGSDVFDVKVGEYVATRGEPAYADVYLCRKYEYVIVPEVHPKYIIEPVACGINVITQDIESVKSRSGPDKRLLIIGTGFLAWIAYRTVQLLNLEFEITVLGKSNADLWGDVLTATTNGTYDVIVDLGSTDIVFSHPIISENSLILFAVEKTLNCNFKNLLWKACTMVFPSPRTPNFYNAMKNGVDWIKNGDIVVDRFWTNSYNRSTQWKDAFKDGANRNPGYNRGYIYWE